MLTRSVLDIEDAALDWKDAVESGKVENVVRLYHEKAAVWGAFSNNLCASLPAIRKYFREILSYTDLSVVFLDREVRIVKDSATMTGVCRYDFAHEGVQSSKVVRFSFSYLLLKDHWVIISEHASLLSDIR